MRLAGRNCCKTLSSTLFIFANWGLAFRFFLGYFLGFLANLKESLIRLEFWHALWSTLRPSSLSDVADSTTSLPWSSGISISTLVIF